jgi:MoaA/NifB/PqqE/SkfB family radical SAM enzyme
MRVLYTKTKVFHYPEKLRSLPLDVPDILPPLHVRIKPTNVCNHNCRYCAYSADTLDRFGKDSGKNRLSIPRDKLMEIIEDLRDMGVKAVTFSGGGEPFVYPHLLEAAQALEAAGIRFASLTNGSRLTGPIAEVFAQHATWVRVSIDGWDGPSYARYRKVGPDEFDRVMNNMQAFKKMGGRCYLGVSLIIDHENAAHVYEMLCRLKAIGVDSAKLSPCLVSDDQDENNRYHQPVFESVRTAILKAVADLGDDTFEIFPAYYRLDEKFEKSYTWCPYLQILPIIGADLNVYPCPDKAYNLKDGVLGSIRYRRFKEFWFADKRLFFRINPSQCCRHHCERNPVNELIMEYLHVDPEHRLFV